MIEIMSNLLPAKCTFILNTHQLSILASLEHRMQVAKLNQNLGLVQLLEIEKKGITPISVKFNDSRSPRNWLKKFIHSFIDNFVPKTGLQIKQLSDLEGNQWWYAYNPQTGKSIYADSDSEIRHWINSECESK